VAYSGDAVALLVVRVDYVDRHDHAVTRLVVVDTRSERVVGTVGSGAVGLSSLAARFIADSDMLVVVCSWPARHLDEGAGSRLT